MQQIPSYGFCIFGVCLFLSSAHKNTLISVVCGVVISIGISIKLTALLIVPAATVAILIKGIDYNSIRSTGLVNVLLHGILSKSNYLKNCFAMFIAACSTFIILAAISPNFSVNNLWFTHLEASKLMSDDAKETFKFSIMSFLDYPSIILGSLLGLVNLIKNRKWVLLGFSCTLLVTFATVHLNHVPFWFFYQFHFAIPFALLFGVGIAGIIKEVFTAFAQEFAINDKCQEFYLTAKCLIICTILTFELPQILSNFNEIYSAEPSHSNSIVNYLKQHKHFGKYGYSDRTALFASVGIGQIADLSVVSYKRYWSGDLTEAQLVQKIESSGCPFICLGKSGSAISMLTELLVHNYTLVAEDISCSLYVHNKFKPMKYQSVEKKLIRLGI